MTMFFVARIASIGILVCTAGFLVFLPLTVKQFMGKDGND